MCIVNFEKVIACLIHDIERNIGKICKMCCGWSRGLHILQISGIFMEFPTFAR